MSTLHVVADANEEEKKKKTVVDGKTTASSSQNIHVPQRLG